MRARLALATGGGGAAAGPRPQYLRFLLRTAGSGGASPKLRRLYLNAEENNLYSQPFVHDVQSIEYDAWFPMTNLRYNDPTLPQRLMVRLIRVRFRRGDGRHTLWVVTTLMDPTLYPARQIAAAYRCRWGIEGRIGSLKTTLEMNVLRSKKTGSLRREVASIILGHNLVWTLIHEAAVKNNVPARDISFACAVKIAVAFSQTLPLTAPSQRPALREKMLNLIAAQRNHHPFGRVEPRKVKRDRRRYSYLKESRAVARKKCLT